VLKKRQRTGPVVMGGPVWGGRQAAGKADSQAFCGKRLPHPYRERPQPRLMQLALCAHNVHTKKKAVEVFLCKQFKRINSLN
jgi:hypothetical protein